LLLKTVGHETEVVYDSESVVKAARSFHPDAVFLDIGLAKMDGFTVASNLREAFKEDKLLVVALSGFTRADYRQRAKEVGFDGYLIKPAHIDDIEALLATIE
jgi:DNA-binding response OmpR family regulator